MPPATGLMAEVDALKNCLGPDLFHSSSVIGIVKEANTIVGLPTEATLPRSSVGRSPTRYDSCASSCRSANPNQRIRNPSALTAMRSRTFSWTRSGRASSSSSARTGASAERWRVNQQRMAVPVNFS